MENEEIQSKDALFKSIGRKSEVTFDVQKLERMITFVELPYAEPTYKREPTLLPKLNLQTGFLVSNSPHVAVASSSSPSTKSKSLPARTPDLKELTARIREETSVKRPLKSCDAESGEPITFEIACGLRKIACASLLHSFSPDWRRGFFFYQELNGPLNFCLFSQKTGVRSLILCVQAYILKNQLFGAHTSSDVSKLRYLTSLTEGRRQEYLLRAFNEILVTVCDNFQTNDIVIGLPTKEKYVETNHIYRADEITETLRLYHFSNAESSKNFLRKHLNYFTTASHPGCVLLLYSIILSHGLARLMETFDYNDSLSLIDGHDRLSLPAINLIATGSAINQLNNKTVAWNPFTEKDELQPGHEKRANIGLLKWTKPDFFNQPMKSFQRRMSESDHNLAQDILQMNAVGSMLKTPYVPIWITDTNNTHGLIFSPNTELLTHWRAENKFQLIYLTCLSSQQEPCHLTINTRRGRTARYRTNLLHIESEKKIPSLEHLIQTKWYGAKVDWNNSTPFV